MSNTNTATTSAPLLFTPDSCWGAAREALRLMRDLPRDGGPLWCGLDERGEVVAGTGDMPASVLPVATDDDFRAAYAEASADAAFLGLSDPAIDGPSESAVRVMDRLAGCFAMVAARIGGDPALLEFGPGPVGAFAGEHGPDDRRPTRRVHFASPSPRDRVAAHVARGCTHCARPRYAVPADPQRWDALAAWESRWKATQLSVAEAALWTDMAGCRPDVAMELRAAGLCPEDLQRLLPEILNEWNDVDEVADELLGWVRAGFPWAEVKKREVWVCAPEMLPLECERRARGLSEQAFYEDEVEIDGTRTTLYEWLVEGPHGSSTARDLHAEVQRLERDGLLPAWGLEDARATGAPAGQSERAA